MKKDQLKQIIKEEIAAALKEEEYAEDLTEDRLEAVLIELNSHANSIARREVGGDDVKSTSFTMGYQRALKDVAEMLLGYVF